MKKWLALVTTAATTAIAIGCATSAPPPDLSDDIDPNLPEVDASHASVPVPAPSDAELADSGKGNAGNGGGSTDAGTKKDAGSSSGSTSSSGGSSSGGSTSSSSGSSGTALPAQGEVLISEVMYDTTGTEPATEWFELVNVASSARTLSGLTLKDGGNRTHVIGAGVTIAAGAYVVFARDEAAAIAAHVPSSAIVYEYGTGLTDSTGILLANGATGALWLYDGGTQIARADYGGWFTQNGGASIELATPSFATSNSSAGWCLASTAWAGGADKGTPGAASDCP